MEPRSETLLFGSSSVSTPAWTSHKAIPALYLFPPSVHLEPVCASPGHPCPAPTKETSAAVKQGGMGGDREGREDAEREKKKVHACMAAEWGRASAILNSNASYQEKHTQKDTNTREAMALHVK